MYSLRGERLSEQGCFLSRSLQPIHSGLVTPGQAIFGLYVAEVLTESDNPPILRGSAERTIPGAEMGRHWAKSARRRRQLERVTLVVFLAAVLLGAGAQIISIPTSTAAEAAIYPGAQVHVVRRGETLTSIARQYHTTIANLVRINTIKNSNRIYAGSSIVVAQGKQPATTTTQPKVSKPKTTPTTARKTTTTVRKTPVSVSGNLPAALRSKPDRLALIPIFDKWADANGISRDLVKATCYMESGWNNNAVSSVGARGIGQLMPDTAKWIAKELIGQPNLSVANPEDNIRMSARYLRYLIKLNNGNEQMALASYYQGFGSIQRNGVRSDTTSYVRTITNLRPLFK